MSENLKVKNKYKQEVTTYTPIVKVSQLYFGRFVSSESVFDSICLDGINYYEFKQLTDSRYWLDNVVLEKLYKYNSLLLGIYFRSQGVPKRCEEFSKKLISEFTDWLALTKGKIFKSKLKTTVNHFIKHVSRLHYHNKFTLIYPKHDKNWQGDRRLSAEYLRLLVAYLQDKGHIQEYTGYQSSKNNITSLLILKPDFILECNGKDESKVSMDECLKVSKVKPLVSITEQDEKGNKYKRNLIKEEKIVAAEMEDVLRAYNDFLSTKMITVNGVNVPELFFTRVFSYNLHNGGRYYDNGDVQHESQSIRKTILIDGEETCEVDYRGLHYAIAAEKLGIDLSARDPYDFDYNIKVDVDAVVEWEKKHKLELPYDPVRNLKKIAILTMFNASSEKSSVSAISKAILDDYRKEDKLKRRLVGIKGVEVKTLIEAIKNHNPEVTRFFNTGVWAEFQNKDSQMMDFCVQEFMKRGEVCIPIHDSLVVKKSLQGFATEVMEDAFQHVMGSKLNCQIK